MKQVYEPDVYKPAEELSDMVRHDFDKWNKKVHKHRGLSDNTIIRQEYQAIVEKLGPIIECVHQQHQSMKAEFLISNFNVP